MVAAYIIEGDGKMGNETKFYFLSTEKSILLAVTKLHGRIILKWRNTGRLLTGISWLRRVISDRPL
jgi:hypothetical protein